MSQKQVGPFPPDSEQTLPDTHNPYRVGDWLTSGTRLGKPGVVLVIASYETFVDLGFFPDGAAQPSEIARRVSVKDLRLPPMRSQR